MTVSFGFGYPTTDSAGIGRTFELLDEAPAGEPGATDWVQAFPRRVTITQQQRQTIRLLVTPPARPSRRGVLGPDHRGAPRAARSRWPASPTPATSPWADAGSPHRARRRVPEGRADHRRHAGPDQRLVRARYRLGAGADDAHRHRRLPRHRASGGGGRPEGGSWRQAERAVGVYYTLDPRLEIPVDSLPAGTYKVRVSVSTDRSDLPPERRCPRRRCATRSRSASRETPPRGPAPASSPRPPRRRRGSPRPARHRARCTPCRSPS